MLHAIVVEVASASGQATDLIGIKRAGLILPKRRSTELASVRLFKREVLFGAEELVVVTRHGNGHFFGLLFEF